MIPSRVIAARSVDRKKTHTQEVEKGPAGEASDRHFVSGMHVIFIENKKLFPRKIRNYMAGNSSLIFCEVWSARVCAGRAGIKRIFGNISGQFLVFFFFSQ